MLSIVVAVDKTGLIGKDGTLPWGHLPNDLKRFREITEGGIVVMGRKTYESLPPKSRPLPNRRNIVLTRDLLSFPYPDDDVEVFADFNVLLDTLRCCKQPTFIIGGAQIYKLFLPYVDKIYLTEVQGEFEGDTWFQFPHNEYVQFEKILVGETKPDEKNAYGCRFYEFRRL